MKKKILSLLLVILFLAVSFNNIYAVNLQKKWIPADSKWIINIDLNSLLKTKIWDEIYKKNRSKFDRKIDKVFREIRLNILKDIDSITLFGNKEVEKDAVILASGNFNKDLIIKRLMTEKEFGKTRSGKYIIYKWDDDAFGTFINNNLILFGHSKTTLKRILDREGGNLSKSDLYSNIKMIPENTLMFALFGDFSSFGRRHKAPFLVQNAKMLIFKVSEFKGNLDLFLSIKAENPEKAKNFMQVANGLIALIRMNKEKKNHEKAMRFLDRLNISAVGDTLKANLTIPASEIANISDKKNY